MTAPTAPPRSSEGAGRGRGGRLLAAPVVRVRPQRVDAVIASSALPRRLRLEVAPRSPTSRSPVVERCGARGRANCPAPAASAARVAIVVECAVVALLFLRAVGSPHARGTACGSRRRCSCCCRSAPDRLHLRRRPGRATPRRPTTQGSAFRASCSALPSGFLRRGARGAPLLALPGSTEALLLVAVVAQVRSSCCCALSASRVRRRLARVDDAPHGLPRPPLRRLLSSRLRTAPDRLPGSLGGRDLHDRISALRPGGGPLSRAPASSSPVSSKFTAVP